MSRQGAWSSTVKGLAAASMLVWSVGAHAQEFYDPIAPTNPVPYAGAPQIQSTSTINRYLGPASNTSSAPTTLYLGPAAGVFTEAVPPPSPLNQNVNTYVGPLTITTGTSGTTGNSANNAIPLGGQTIGTQIRTTPLILLPAEGASTGATTGMSAPTQAIPLSGGTAVSAGRPVEIVPLPDQPPLIIPLPGGMSTTGGGGEAASGGTVVMTNPEPMTGGETGGGQSGGSAAGGAVITEGTGEAGGTTQIGEGGAATATATEETGGEAAAADDTGAAMATEQSSASSVSEEDGDEEDDKERKKREEIESTQRAMSEMAYAQQQAEAQLGYQPITDPTGEHTKVEHQQIMGADVMAQINQLGQSLGNKVSIALPEAIEVKVDKEAVRRLIEAEKRRIAKEKADLKKRLEKERKRLEKEKKKIDKQRERNEKDKKYRDRRAREEQQRKSAADLNKQNEDLKKRAEKMDKAQKDLDKLDKDLRNKEQEARANDPNCNGADCQKIREERTKLSGERTKLVKEQGQFQKDAQKFNATVKEWQANQRELDDLKDRGYGMNDAERAERRDQQKLAASNQTLREVEKAKMDLQRQAKWLEAEGELDADAADELRKQWKALGAAEEKAKAGISNAEADLLKSQAGALGVGDAYDEAMKYFKPDYKGDRPRSPDELPGLYDAMKDAQRLANASPDTLDKVSKMYGDAINQTKEIEKRIGADIRDPKNMPPVNAPVAAEMGQITSEFHKISEELKKINPNSFMADKAWRDAGKERNDAARALEQHERNLQKLGDSDATGVNANSNSVTGNEPLEFRSQAELARRHSFSYTGPEALRDEVMKERAALEKATGDFLAAQEKMDGIRDSSAAYQKGKALWERASELKARADFLSPLADVNQISDDVAQFNSHLKTGLPRDANGEIDEQAVFNRVEAMAKGQMALLQNGVALEQAQRQLAANPGDGNASKMVSDLQNQQQQIVKQIGETGVTIETKDGKFTPRVLSNSTADMWNTAREQTVATLEEIDRNRQAAGMGSNPNQPRPPGEAGGGSLDRKIDQGFAKEQAEKAAFDKVANAPTPVSPDVARSPATDLNQLTNARETLKANIAGLSQAVDTLPADHPAAPALIATRTNLEAAAKSVDGAIAKVEAKAAATKLRTEQLGKAAKALETNINAIDERLAQIDGWTPEGAALTTTRNALEAAARSVDTALKEVEPKPAELTAPQPVPTGAPITAPTAAPVAAKPVSVTPEVRETLARNKEVLGTQIDALEKQIGTVSPESPHAVALVATRDALKAGLASIEKALAVPVSNASTLSPARQKALEGQLEQISQQRVTLNEQLKAVPADSPEAAKLREKSAALAKQQEEIDRELGGTETAPAPAPTPTPAPVAAAKPEVVAPTTANRRAVLEQKLEKITQQRVAINDRLKGLPADGPEAQKLRDQSALLAKLQEEIDSELNPPAANVPAASTPAAASATTTPAGKSIDSDPELTGLREQMFGLDTKMAQLPPGSAEWVTAHAKRLELMNQYVVRYVAVKNATAAKQRASASTPAEDPLANYMDWLERDILPQLKGSTADLARTVLTNLVMVYGPERAEEIVHNALDETLEFGDGNRAEVFLDAVLKRMAATVRETAGAEAARSIEMGRVQILRVSLSDPAVAKSTELTNELTSRLETAAKALREELGREVAKAANKPDIKLGLLGEVAALSQLDGSDLGPLTTEIEQEIDRLRKQPLKTGSEGEQHAAALQRLGGLLEGLQPPTAELAERLSKLRIATIGLLRQQMTALAEAAPPERAAALKTAAAKLLLRESAAELAGGNLLGALDLLRRAGTETALSASERDLALIAILDRIRAEWAQLDDATRAKLLSLEAVLQERDKALERMAASSNPAEAASATLARVRTALATGDRATAQKLVDEILKRRPDDAILQAEKLTLALTDPAQPLTAERVNETLAKLPAPLRLPAGLVALNRLLETGEANAAVHLIEKLRLLADGTEDAKALSAYLDARRALALAGSSDGKVTLADVRKAIDAARESLQALAAGNPMMAAELERINLLSAQIDQIDTLEKALAGDTQPAAGFDALAREALSIGRLDLAEKALQRFVQALFDGSALDNATALRGLRNAAMVLETVRRRAAQGDLTAAQRSQFEAFLGRAAPVIGDAIDRYLAERMIAAEHAVARAVTDPKMSQVAGQRLAELRALERMNWMVKSSILTPEQQASAVSAAESAATQRVNEKIEEIKKKFGGLAKAVNEDATLSQALDQAMAELDALRARRDGITDFKLSFTAPPEFDPRTRSYGFLQPRTARDQEIRRLEGLLVGAEPGETASQLWDMRRQLRNYQFRKGARERLLVESGFEPTDRELRNNPAENGDYWLKMRLLAREVTYLDRRRAELVLEDSRRPGTAGTDLLNKLIAHESKILTDLVGPGNALDEMLQQITGFGNQNRELAKILSSQIPQNEISGWMGEIEQARHGGDVQKGFLSLVRLRDASLAGEIEAFVNYLQMPWYKAGPARAYNLVVGMSPTQTAVEAATVESARLHATLIRAANNLPESLSEDDRKLLTRHGFLENGKYVMPEHVRVTPTSAGSEFAEITQQGVLGTVDRVLNAQHAAELVATVAIPGGIAGRLGRAVTAELIGTSRLLAHGLGLAAETAAFTGLSRGARAALDPELLATKEFWSGRALLAEYGHNLLTLGVLKIKGVGTAAANSAIAGVTRVGLRTQLEGAARAVDLFGEAALLTGLNGALSSNAISRETFLENVLVVSLLRATHLIGEVASEKLGLNRPPEVPRELPDFARRRAAEIRYQEWLDAYYIPARRLMEQFKGDWAAARKAYTKGELSESQMRRLVQMRRWVVDTLAKEILGELKGDVEAFGSENLTSDYDISFVGPKAQVAVILFNARFNARWGAAIDIGGRETGVTLDTNAYTRSEHLNYAGGGRDVWMQDSYAHLAARKYLGEAEWKAYRARVEASADPARQADIKQMLDGVEAEYTDLKAAIDAKVKELTGSVTKEDLQITAENRLYEDTLRDVADLIERYEKASEADKEALAQQIRNAQSRALFYAQEAYNTQAAIVHVVTTIQAGKRAITVESLLGKDPPKLNVPLTADQARQSYIEQIANMMKELSHGGDGEKLAGKAAKYFIRALDAAKIAGLDISALEDVIRATVELNDVRSDIGKVKDALKARYPEGGSEAYLKAVSDGINALNKAFFGGAEVTSTAANDNTPPPGTEAAGGEPPPTPPEAPPAAPPPGDSNGTGNAAPRANDPNAETAVGPAPQPAVVDAQAGGTTETAAAARTAYDSGLQVLAGDPMFARWMEATVTTADTMRRLALIGLTRSLLDPAERLQADVALATAEGLINLNPDLAGINLLDVARYVNLHAGRSGPGETGVAGGPNAAQLAVEAVLTINPTARIRIRDLVAAGHIDGGRAREYLNGARRDLARQEGKTIDTADALDRRPLTSYTAEPLQLLNRIDLTQLVQRPRVGEPGDAAFFAANDLLPRLTIDVGGEKFHVTEPFRGPGGRITVIAFQEASDGSLVPRTFYLSGEHGVWRAAVAMAGNLISKGPMRLMNGSQEVTAEDLVDPKAILVTKFVNESSVDLGAEMQGILSRWATTKGARELERDVMERAFFGHLEQGQNLEAGAEFQSLVTRADVEQAFAGTTDAIPDNLLPDLVTGALDTWRVESQVYGRLDGATYLSRDGSVVYVVLRDTKGNVFVPSIQDATVGLTPFGTRWRSYQTTLNSTPRTHGGGGYVANNKYGNALNNLFR